MIDISICQLTGVCLNQVLPSVGTDLADTAATAFLTVITTSLAEAGSWLVGHVVALANVPSPDLTVAWFAGEEQRMQSVVELVLLPVLMVATLGSILRQDFRRLGRVWAVGLPVAVLAGVVGPTLADLGLRATDQMSDWVAPGHAGSLTDQLGGSLSAVVSSGAPVMVKMLVLFLMIVGGMLIWLELLLRSSAVYLAVFFMPLALVAYIWPATAHLARRVIEIVTALILSKFVIIAALVLGQAALRGKSGDASLDGAITGSAILLLAAFAPFCLIRLAPVMEAAAIAHLEGISRRPIQAATGAATTAVATAVPAARTLLAFSRRSPAGAGVGTGGGEGAEAGTGAVPVSAPRLPERPPDYPVRSGSGVAEDGS